jgi:hypothetical protein
LSGVTFALFGRKSSSGFGCDWFPGVIFGLLFGIVNLRTGQLVISYSVLSGLIYFAAVQIAIRLIRDYLFDVLVDGLSCVIAGFIAGSFGALNLALILKLFSAIRLDFTGELMTTAIGGIAGVIFLLYFLKVNEDALFASLIGYCSIFIVWQVPVGLSLSYSINYGQAIINGPEGFAEGLNAFLLSPIIPLIGLIVSVLGIIGSIAIPGKKLAWWEHLVFERPKENFTTCESCGTSNDSVDVVCTVDNATLVGTHMADRTKEWIVNLLRAAAMVVALAVGYLYWKWPTYVLSGFVMIAFFSLFLRNHSISRLFFIVISTLSFISYGVWKIVNPEDLSLLQVIGLILATLLVLKLLFLVAYTLRTDVGDPRQEWMLSNNVDLRLGTQTWITFMLTTTVLCILAFITNWAAPEFMQWFLPIESLGLLLLRSGLVTLGAAEIAALVSCTVYSLRGEPFYVTDRWNYRSILHKQVFRRVPRVTPPTFTSWTTRLKGTLERIAVASANGIIEGIENAYNNFIVRFFNNLARAAIRIANSVRRVVIKTVLHIIRSLRRFIVLNKWCAKWAWHTGLRYAKVFIIPLMLFLVSAILVYSMGEDFFDYVHGGSAITPVILSAKGLAVIIAFTIGTGLLFLLNLLAFFEKMLNALSIFGTSAFLFFVLTAWLLGIIGMLTNGPYRIGWVTILSTLVLVAVFFLAQRRSPDRETKG